MTRRKFIADFSAAKQCLPPDVASLKQGEDDGQVDCVFAHEELHSPLLVRLQTLDIDNYPVHPGFLAFTTSDDSNEDVEHVLESLSGWTENTPVADALKLLSREIRAVLGPDNDNDVAMTEEEEDECLSEAQSDELGFSLDDNGELSFEIDDDPTMDWGCSSLGMFSAREGDQRIPERLVRDLQTAQRAGFSVGILSGTDRDSGPPILSLSIPVHKLGLSEETLTAWDVEPSEWLVLLGRYKATYSPLETYLGLSLEDESALRFRFGKCTHFKPSYFTAARAFLSCAQRAHNCSPEQQAPANNVGLADDGGEEKEKRSFTGVLASNSINMWMHNEFLNLLKLRVERGLSWDGAVDRMNRMRKTGHLRGSTETEADAEQETGSHEALVAESAATSLNQDFVLSNPASATTSKVKQSPEPCALKERSLPLIAAQFALRYFAKSAQYCMVCHRKSEGNLVAMKPYVCTEPLCLYQYMALGFGPSIEHEIIKQPLVVDLLISFFYSALISDRLRELPQGLKINVPLLGSDAASLSQHDPNLWNNNTPTIRRVQHSTPILGEAQFEKGILLLKGTSEAFSTSAGTLFVLVQRSPPKQEIQDISHVAFHCRVQSSAQNGDHSMIEFECFAWTRKNCYLAINDGDILENQDLTQLPKEEVEVCMYHYEHDLDDLPTRQQIPALIMLLDTMPPVSSMRQDLTRHAGSTMAHCSSLSPPALAVLRWVVASNRSLILQIDCPPSAEKGDYAELVQNLNREDEKLDGLHSGFMQFRFAQGSPEKEHRFNSAIDLNRYRNNHHTPTIFAWHGSRVGNWHSIIRQGLDFKETVHGRAYGDGVYLSPHFTTSMGYSGDQYAFSTQQCNRMWSNSQLKVASAISVCEIVNRPDKFVSSKPHYVVNDPDWIQCRYLLVQKVSPGGTTKPAPPPKKKQKKLKDREFACQDPFRVIRGPYGGPIRIPEAALPKRRAPPASATTEPESSTDTRQSPDSVGSQADLPDERPEDDLDILLRRMEQHEDRDKTTPQPQPLSPKVSSAPPKTPFRPGALNLATLPKLPSPTWADDQGRKVLSRELRKLQKVQSSTSLDELGWYIDFDKMDNLFHWVVEMHSFELSLPLAKDMELYNIGSIVFEIRFGRQFPMSPPFMRVIRPRFVPFSQGGGGHVTAGGAMCLEMLTNSGWSPAMSIENVLVQVHMALCNPEPRPAKLKPPTAVNGDYGIEEAISAYKRAARMHGWQIPPDLESTARAD